MSSRSHEEARTQAAKLCLPGEEVEQCRQRLPDQTERDPEYHVPNDRSVDALDLLQDVREDDQWYLPHHAQKGDPYSADVSPEHASGQGRRS